MDHITYGAHRTSLLHVDHEDADPIDELLLLFGIAPNTRMPEASSLCHDMRPVQIACV